MSLKYHKCLISVLYCCLIGCTTAKYPIIGTLEKCYIPNDVKEDSTKYFALGLFKKNHGKWDINSFTKESPSKIKFNAFYDCKSLGKLNTKIDTQSYYKGHIRFPYSISGNKTPIGPKSNDYEGWAGVLGYRPLLISNYSYCEKKSKLKNIQISTTDSTALIQFLQNQCESIKLGEIVFRDDASSLIHMVNWCYQINDSFCFINVNLNFNFYAILDSVKFNENFMESPKVIKTAEKQRASEYNYSNNVCFAISKNRIKHIGNNLTLLDYGDFDNNQENEYIFMLQEYNHDGYVLISNGFKDVLVYGWRYH